MDELEIEVSLQISRPPEEVFSAIIDPQKMSNYFISESSGVMEQGKNIVWKFPEFDSKVPISVRKIYDPELIEFEWEGTPNTVLTVKIQLKKIAEHKTLVRITEGKMKNNKEGIEWFGRNSGGWANFLACLKAYLEFGINLRKGGFDYMQTSE